MAFYSYSRDSYENDSVAYLFSTKAQTEYRVYFYPAGEYSQYVQNYNQLSKHGYYCGFTKVEPNEGKNENFDHRIEETIKSILIDFINEMGKDVILIYHCDYHDGRQEKRNNRFKVWYQEMIEAGYPVFMDTAEVITVDEDGNPILTNYIGFCILDDNPNKDEILAEFHSVKEDLIKEK